MSDGEAASGLGMACTRVLDRVEAAFGQVGEAPSEFAPSLDVPCGGVLWALPALLSNGLLRHGEKFSRLPPGFYGAAHIFLLLSFMALCRIKTIEQLRYARPGELGKLLGLDRAPEVRTLREKVKALADEKVYEWSRALTRDWMEGDGEAAGVLYVDGRVTVYHGHQTTLPRRYVSRQRLCLRGVTDYWVNDSIGRPFFVVNTPLNDGLLARLREDIVPRLLEDVPDQPSPEQLSQDPDRPRFVLIFDREGYSPEFFAEMWRDYRVACQTYRKYPGEPWPEDEFEERRVALPAGQTVTMRLCERRTRLSNGFEVREMRKLGERGHQTSVLSSDYRAETVEVAAHMFSRWSQENFFKYMSQNFDIDRLISYETEAADETLEVVNPDYRQIESARKSLAARLARKHIEFSQLSLNQELGEKPIKDYEGKKALVREAIEQLQAEIEQIKQKRKETPRKLALSQLPEDQRLRRIAPARKHFLDTLKMIAYRAETAMALEVRKSLARPDDARALLRELFTATADILPDPVAQTLTVRLHHLTNPLSTKAVHGFAHLLNETETLYPGTNLRLLYEVVSNPNPPDQEF